MEQLVSVIVPVYNVEKYLCQCVDSILSQKYVNLEVILVDDGSSDNSPEICDDYALQDTRVKVIHKDNGGAADARNTGLASAAGEYVIFLDSDDYWANSEVISTLVKVFENSKITLDFVNFNRQYFYQADNRIKLERLYAEAVIMGKNAEEAVPELIRQGMFTMSAGMKLIKKRFLEDNHIRFIKGIATEDIPWFLDVLAKSRYFKFVNEYFYIYRKQVGGSVSSNFSEKKYNDLLLILCNETVKIQNNYPESELKKALLSFCAYEYCILLGMVNFFSRKKRRKQVIKLKEYRWLLQYDLHPKVRKVRLLSRLLGIYLTRWILFLYIRKMVNRN